MLRSLDILIGFSVVMLVVSMTVTVIMQIVSNVLHWRGKKLVDGVAMLLHQIDPALLTKERARTIAEQILGDPMVKAANEKFASVIHREELIKIILQLAATAPAQQQAQAAAASGQAVPAAAAAASAAGPNADCMQMLAAALRNAGIPDPGGTLESVRMRSMRLEAARPDLATHAREALAIITEAESQFVAKVNGWFDQTMDRVSQAFAVHTRFYTVVVSVLLAAVLQLDAVAIVNRLAMDDTLRNSLVAQAQSVAAGNQPAQASQEAPPSAQAPGQGGPLSPEERARAEELAKEAKANLADLQQLATSKLFTLPGSPGDWVNRWGQTNVFGVALSALLLSLGAPFWFDALKNLLKLRPMLASKDDTERQERLSQQQPTTGEIAPGPAALAAAAGGGGGDPKAG